MKNTTTIFSVIIAFAIIGGAFIFTKGRSDGDVRNAPIVNNVTMENGVQIVEIKARGGYLPRRSVAQAGIPTVIRFNTNGTFDCSSAMRIPSLNISKNLPISGNTDVDIPLPQAGILRGSCSMGMYSFEVDFQS
jgi:plastocyanin domain-containing protein